MTENTPYPPKLFLKFFRWFCHPDLVQYIEGDLIELYYDHLELYGQRKADRFFIKDVILLFRPSIIRPAGGYQRLNNYGMFKNYFKVAIRNLIKNKAYVLINTFGMGIALACCMSAYILVAFNIEFNDSVEASVLEDKVLVLHKMEYENGRLEQHLVSPIVMGPIAKEEIAGIEEYSRYIAEPAYVSLDDKAFSEEITYVDKSFLDMFEYELITGSSKNFQSKESIFLSEKMAEKYFGYEDPVGKTLTVEVRNQQKQVIVGGVFESAPYNSYFTYNILMRVENYLETYNIGPDSWDSWRESTLIFSLTDINQRESINQQLDKYIPIRNNAKTDTKSLSFELVPFDNDLNEDDILVSYANLPISFLPLLIFITLGSIILLIAAFNLTNTTIAITVKRLKEIGVRKVVGARRWQVVFQFLLEIVITVILATLAGLLMAQFIVPEFIAMWGKSFPSLEELNGINFMITIIILLFLSSVLAGAYPAIFNSRFNPIKLLKGNLRIKGTNPLVRVLLVMQFSLSIVMLVAGIVFTQNATYQKAISFGYDTDQVIVVDIQGPKDYEKLRNAIQTNPKIEYTAVTDHHFGYGSYTNPIRIDTSEMSSNVYEVGSNYFHVMGLDIVVGRDFIEGSQLDYESAAIVDENFVKRHNLKEPLNTRIVLQDISYHVVGVVKNHLSNLFDPMGMDKDHFYRMVRPDQYRSMVVRTDANSINEVNRYMEKQWKGIFPHKPFLSQLQEDIIYSGPNTTNRNLKKIFLFLTFLGCLLSVSGIYSLASLNIERRTKEVAVRKVLGATVRHIVKLVNKEFAIILFLSAIFGGLGGYYLTTALLGVIYVQHTEVGLFTVILCGLLIFLVGISTTSITIFKAATASPVSTLKDE